MSVSHSETVRTWPSSACCTAGVAVHGRDREVVPRRPVEVHDDRVVAERVGDGPRDRSEEIRQVLLGAHEAGDLEQPPKRGNG